MVGGRELNFNGIDFVNDEMDWCIQPIETRLDEVQLALIVTNNNNNNDIQTDSIPDSH